MKKYVIIAPHADDEVIGCYRLLETGLVETVVFGSEDAATEAEKSAKHYNFNIDVIDIYQFDYSGKIYLFPDPTYELHPLHRQLGMRGEALLRARQRVIFYTTNMLAPYIFEVYDAINKRSALNILYTEKSKLWKYDHKYFLFEGYTEWLIEWAG